MGQNTIGNTMKFMASCLNKNKKLTNHSMMKTLVSNLKKSGQPRNVICEVPGHARESSLDYYDQIDENQRKELSHIISEYKEVPKENTPNDVSNQNTANEASNQVIAVQRQQALLVPIHHVQKQGQMHQTMGFNPGFQPAGFSGFPPSFPSQFRYRMASFTCAGSSVSLQNYTDCTFNFFSKDNEKSQPQSRGNEELKSINCFCSDLRTV